MWVGNFFLSYFRVFLPGLFLSRLHVARLESEERSHVDVGLYYTIIIP